MMRARTRQSLLCSLAALTLCLGACSDDDDVAWQSTELDGGDAYYSSVWAASPDDVFVAGGVTGGVVEHFDGQTWTTMEIPGQTPALIWVFGFAPDDVYAVGERGAFIHYNGTVWERLDSNTSKTLWGAWGPAPDDLWMVGGNIGSGRITIRHWNGTESEVFEVDTAEYAENVHSLFKVWGDGTNVYAVGQLGTVLRYDGSAWTAIDTGESSEDFISVWGRGPNEVYFAGGRGLGRVARRAAVAHGVGLALRRLAAAALPLPATVPAARSHPDRSCYFIIRHEV